MGKKFFNCDIWGIYFTLIFQSTSEVGVKIGSDRVIALLAVQEVFGKKKPD